MRRRQILQQNSPPQTPFEGEAVARESGSSSPAPAAPKKKRKTLTLKKGER